MTAVVFFSVWGPRCRPDHGTTLAYNEERPPDIALAESLVRWSQLGEVPPAYRGAPGRSAP